MSRESDLISSAPSCNISILHLYIFGFLSHKRELEATIRLMTSPSTIICLNKTFLDKSTRSFSHCMDTLLFLAVIAKMILVEEVYVVSL